MKCPAKELANIMWKKHKGIYTLYYEDIAIATIYPLHIDGYNSVLFNEDTHHYHDELAEAKASIMERLKAFSKAIA